METKIISDKDEARDRIEDDGVYYAETPGGNERILIAIKERDDIYLIDKYGNVQEITKDNAKQFYKTIKKIKKLKIDVTL